VAKGKACLLGSERERSPKDDLDDSGGGMGVAGFSPLGEVWRRGLIGR